MAKRFGIFNQPKVPSEKTQTLSAPWAFEPSSADQRAAPSAAAGDYYGTAYRQKIGRIRGDTVGYRPVNLKQMGTPPTYLA